MKIANFSSNRVTLYANEKVGTSYPVPIPVTDAEVAAAIEEQLELDGQFDPSQVGGLFRDILTQVCTVSFEGEEKPIPDSTEVDPEAQHDTATKKQGFEGISLKH